MTFGPVSPVKGNRFMLAALVLTLTIGLFTGVATFVVPSEAAAPPQVSAAPVLLYGLGDAAEYTGNDAKSLGLRRREVAFDGAVLADLVPMDGAYSATLALFDNMLLTADIDQTNRDLLGSQSFSGRIADTEHGYFLMSLDCDGRALLQVDLLDEGLVYIVAQDPDTGAYFVSEHNVADLRPPKASDPRMPVYDKNVPPDPVKLEIGENVITDVLVVYTPAAEQWARNNRTGIDNVLSQAFERGNTTLRDSDVDMRLRMVHARPIDYVESPDYDSDLDNLTFTPSFNPLGLDPEDFLVEVHDWRQQYGADIVMMINVASASDLGVSGTAWLLTDIGGNPQLGFCVVSVEYANETLIHQIGHNLGCNHSRNQTMSPAPPSPEGGLFDYSTGWRWSGLNGRRYASIMAEPEFDFSTFQYDTQVFLFSNPDINYAGAPTGSYEGEYAPADNARTIRESKSIVAGYRAQVVPDEGEGEGEGEEEGEDPEPSRIWYVNINSPYATQNGDSWETAFKSLQQALNVATDNHEIWVARSGDNLYGAITGDTAVPMRSGVRMYGGFIGVEETKLERDIFTNATVIDGRNERVAVTGANNTVLDGFIIANGGMVNENISMTVRNCGFRDNPVGMTNTNSILQVNDCIFMGNVAGMVTTGGEISIARSTFEENLGVAVRTENVVDAFVNASVFMNNREGGMVNVNVENMQIGNSIFDGNSAPQDGGAIANTNSIVHIAYSTFLRNQTLRGDGGAIAGGILTITAANFRENIAAGAGGAIARPGADSVIRNSRFSLNRAAGEGGALILDTNVRLENCIVYGNRVGEGASGAGIAVENGIPQLWNITLARNFGHAMHVMDNIAAPRLTNCIIWGNTDGILSTNNATSVITYSNVQGGVVPGLGNISVAPQFRNPVQGDLYLLETSPCIDSGIGTGAPADDIVGEVRPQGTNHDMGAWEFVGPDGGDAGEGPTTDPTEGESEEGEGEDEDTMAATFEITSLVRDREALLPLYDWVPLFRFSMKYGEEDFAPRLLQRLVYTLVNDPNDDDRGLNYAALPDLHQSDLLEFGMFWDAQDQEDEDGDGAGNDGEPLIRSGDLLLTWDHNSRFVTFRQDGGLRYELNLLNAPYTPEAGQETEERPDGNAFIVAVRTSATWRSQLTLGVKVTNDPDDLPIMIDPNTGEIPVNIDDEGVIEYIDEYTPDFYGEDPEGLDAEAFYSSSFGVYDPSGPVPPTGTATPMPNIWQHTPFIATPTGEFTRPRWNKPGQLLSMYAADFIEERRIMALEEWVAVIGINIHSTGLIKIEDEYVDGLMEANVILTDVGADPYGPEGNGGFNPRNALKPLDGYGNRSSLFHRGHVVHNGIWMWRDVNRNGIFDPPVQTDGGVTPGADYPLLGDPQIDFAWEYIPFPPGGGDPWWKVRLRFSYSIEYLEGLLAVIEKQPNNAFPDADDDGQWGSEFTHDFFVVTRADSGFKDFSLTTGNPGATYGAEFRAFIEPKRVDPFTNTYSGGIFTASQNYDFLDDPSDQRWLPNEPWWPERTLNATVAKPFRLGVEVHDMVLTYDAALGVTSVRALEDWQRYLDFNSYLLPAIDTDDLAVYHSYTSMLSSYPSYGYSPINNNTPTYFSRWLDPFGQSQRRFINGHVVNAHRYSGEYYVLSWLGTTFLTPVWGRRQYSFESMPFFKESQDLPPYGPRSSAYPSPPLGPTLPSYDTWPGILRPGQYPALTDWDPKYTGARLLTQKTEPNSGHVAMLGINATGSVDPIVNSEGNSITLAQITVAFWGPGFTPDTLKPLDPKSDDNQSIESGVLLWDKGEGLGSNTPLAFLNFQDLANYQDTPLPLIHTIIPVTGLRWGSAPEFIDLDGNGLPTDMNGDGVVDEQDKAWVLTMYPRNQWELPRNDALDSGDGGCDLYITASTSENVARFQQFRAIVPATLPSRAENRRRAGIQFYPPVSTSPKAFLKANGDEDPVYGYYGHDMLLSNIPVRIEDMTQRWSDIYIGGTAAPVIGLNIASNRPGGTVSMGTSGIGYDNGFYAEGQRWRDNELIGDFLIDDRYESYEIIGNSADTLTLFAGTPRNGAWRVVRDPSFLEEVTVELYQEGTFATFNPLIDLLPLDIDQRISGLALYRDNDNHPDNRNGIFDPDIDIPMMLDAPPRFSGTTADEVKVRFVFSTPGTGDYPVARADQPRNRQWVHDSFGVKVSDPENGPDFFVVMRASSEMQVGDNFRVGVVSWGPNTPSEPDPHIWANLAGGERNDYLKFREFPWAERGVGFITYFKTPPISYYLHGAKASQRPDTSGLNWIRTHSTQKNRSGVMTARNRAIGPRSLVIESASQTLLPIQTLPGQGFSFLIYGKNFGNNPAVVLSGYDLIINSAKDDTISVTISTRPGSPPQEPVTLVVRNPQSGDEASRSDLFTLTSDFDVYGPKILRVNPSRGRKGDFPVTIEGMNFFNVSEVRFGDTRMPILDVSPDGTKIIIGFPVGGMARTGLLDVFVLGGSKNNSQDIKTDGFEYINPESRPKVRYCGCAPAPYSDSGFAGDAVLFGAVIALLAAARARQKQRA